MTLKELRKTKNLTQEDASLICNIPLRTYKRLEIENNNNSYQYKSALMSLSSYIPKKNNNKSYNILIVGAGYVGFSLAILLSLNNKVTVIDINENKVNKINNREPIFKDKEIETYLKTKKLNLEAFTPDISLYNDKDYIIISIPTDFNNETKLLDTSNIRSLVEEIRRVNKKVLIVIKSSCYIGFTESLNYENVIFVPEFLREGKALYDNLNPSRIIIGGDKSNPKVKEFASLLYNSSINNPNVLYMSSNEAEAVKLFSNAYLAMRVSFFNEIDSLSIKNNINAKNIVEGVSLDPRIGDYYNNPSFGYGGYCLPKDTLSLISQMNDVYDDSLISSIDRSNRLRKEYIANDIINRLKSCGGTTVGIYLIQSKKDSDNKRHAAILDVIDILKENNIKIIYYDDISLEDFKTQSDIIIANRYDSSLDDVASKVYTRDLFRRD